MKLIVLLASAMCVALVGSHPVPEGERFRSEALDRLVMVEADNETALRSKRTIGILRELFPEVSQDVNPEAEDRVNEVAAESQNNEVKVQFADEQGNDDSAAPLTPLDEVEAEDDENRNKRFLNFGFGASGDKSGSGAGSGNFLFDIIRQAADGAARAAGTVYRVVAGTQSLGLGLSASRDLGPVPQGAAPAAAPAGSSTTAGSSTSAPAASGTGNLPPLVAGSGSASHGTGKVEEPPEAVPGPVTRLFVIANRGISNLIQDLILRLAATSERIVNFKARLITSII
ncbi:uncharacterized protein LOC117612034 isoform X1 [Osmia lignaria lignaria]|uniref:uncharacterized protein LOC117612034 isoform X1 n=1 Tax=Osmia lignaria lignaria TaxID=1437193 RepID=UPI0014782ECA|nr:uncharacterized protein LOC117612034 isoform X1 [Osmia lignaria]XP_034196560.1 uncharacterized protein LOC117612034 isoform X1 [Osmia lignaria]